MIWPTNRTKLQGLVWNWKIPFHLTRKGEEKLHWIADTTIIVAHQSFTVRSKDEMRREIISPPITSSYSRNNYDDHLNWCVGRWTQLHKKSWCFRVLTNFVSVAALEAPTASLSSLSRTIICIRSNCPHVYGVYISANVHGVWHSERQWSHIVCGWWDLARGKYLWKRLVSCSKLCPDSWKPIHFLWPIPLCLASAQTWMWNRRR
jgi:hypothetical protein